jgi:hypothetical protein
MTAFMPELIPQGTAVGTARTTCEETWSPWESKDTEDLIDEYSYVFIGV